MDPKLFVLFVLFVLFASAASQACVNICSSFCRNKGCDWVMCGDGLCMCRCPNQLGKPYLDFNVVEEGVGNKTTTPLKEFDCENSCPCRQKNCGTTICAGQQCICMNCPS